jgi:hypothetical protein
MLIIVGGESMSTALITALRESCGYLCDGGYHQTARLMAAAADEIDRLREQVQALESGAQEPPTGRHAVDRLRGIASAHAADLPPARRGVNANR